MKVFIITDVEAGWDCVRGVYKTLKSAVEHGLNMEFIPDKSSYHYQHETRVIHEKTLEE